MEVEPRSLKSVLALLAQFFGPFGPTKGRVLCILTPNHLTKINYCCPTVFYSKMAIILPTGQWYAPSAVINDAWCCMVLHCIA